jgi:hypothetical protein
MAPLSRLLKMGLFFLGHFSAGRRPQLMAARRCFQLAQDPRRTAATAAQQVPLPWLSRLSAFKAPRVRVRLLAGPRQRGNSRGGRHRRGRYMHRHFTRRVMGSWLALPAAAAD